MKKLSKEYKRLLKIGKCIHCQNGNFNKCNIQNKKGPGFIQFAINKIKWFCNLGCILLYFDDKKIGQKILD